MTTPGKVKNIFNDESVPAHPELNLAYPVVVFGDHRLCAGVSKRVRVMPSPHMHSQFEINIVRRGFMTYWYAGQKIVLRAGELAVFWGMIPHQVRQCAALTDFVVLYVPMSALLAAPDLAQLRQRLFDGSFLRALAIQSFDLQVFDTWWRDLNGGDPAVEQLVSDEVIARLRRFDRQGWSDLVTTPPRPKRKTAPFKEKDSSHKIELMAQFIGEHALEAIDVNAVAKAAKLHPNYAMGLFKRAMGVTIRQSITRHRLDAVCSMLIATELPISTIAFDCGFGSLSSFYESFEQRFKTSPASFRKSVLLTSTN